MSTGNTQGKNEIFIAETLYTDISVSTLVKMLDSKDFLLVNVHIPLEGNIPQTDLSIPFDDIDSYLHLLPPEKDAKIILYCKGNSMSRSAAAELAELGFTNIFNLEDGYTAWVEAGLVLERN